MNLGVYFAVCDDMPLDSALSWISAMGATSIEVPVHRGSRFDVTELVSAAGAEELRERVEAHGLRVSAINVSADGQLLLGPHHADTDWICEGDADAKRKFAVERLALSAELAPRLGTDTVTGFVGCEDYSRWFPWPDEDAWQKMEPAFVANVRPTLDTFHSADVRFAVEPHPRQFVYNTETAYRSLQLLDWHPAWWFNVDPANLAPSGVDPVTFVAELGDRIANVHAKDAELVSHLAARSGLHAHGPWGRPGRGFRFRVPGWGDVPWRRFITELSTQGYGGALTVEHEDPTMGNQEGIEKAVAFLEPLLLRGRSH